MNILSSMLNYLLDKAKTAADKIGTGSMTTTATTLIGAVNELNAKRRNDTAAGYSTEANALTTSYAIVPMGGDYVVGSSFYSTSDGGYRALKSGVVLVSAFCAAREVNAGDSILACIGRYNSGWVYESAGHFAVGSSTEKSCDVATFPMSVNANDIIYLRARNATGARGNVTSARLVVEYT